MNPKKIVLRKVKPIYDTIMDWDDSLIWCPSQCYKRIEYKGNQFVIFLRWRWRYPWTAEIVQCLPDNRFYMHNPTNKWYRLNVRYWKTTKLKQLKNEVDHLVKEWLIKNIK